MGSAPKLQNTVGREGGKRAVLRSQKERLKHPEGVVVEVACPIPPEEVVVDRREGTIWGPQGPVEGSHDSQL